MSKASDHFWLFGVRPHQDDTLLNALGKKERNWGSRITPAEAAFMLGVPNVIMVNAHGIPVPFTSEARQYCESFRRLKRVMWSACGSGGFRSGNEEKFICELAENYPNVVGAFLDDFFGGYGTLEETSRLVDTLRTIRTDLDRAPRRLPIYAVWYAGKTDGADPQLFDYLDGITIWTWDADELPELEKRFEKIEQKFPRHRKLLGIYMYDFPNRREVPAELMAHQCELGLCLMRSGRLDGLIFEANSVMGVGLGSEKYLREWIDRTRDIELPDTIGFDAGPRQESHS